MQKVRWGILILLILIVFGVWYAVLKESQHTLMVAFLNIGQGDATFIESPTGTQVLIDGGPGRSVLRELGSVMPFYDRSIDVLIATHPDADHVGGLPEVLKRFDVSYILEPGTTSDTGVYTAFEEGVEIEDAEYILARRGHVIDIGGGAFVRVLFPDRDVSFLESNTSSVIVQLIYGAHEFMLTGDSPKSVEEYLSVIEEKNLESDVLKIGHHGSRTSTSALLLGWTDPEYAVISRGCDNRYGHPHEEVLSLLKQFEIKTFDTCEDGRVVFESDGSVLKLK